MQKEILLFFINISNPFLDFIANFSSLFGEQTILILILSIVMYAYDKNKGFAICGSLVISLVSMGTLKAIIRAPRPFTVLEEIQGKRLETATGYSFPSGHTTGAASMYSSLSFAIKKRKISIICATIIVLVGLSRMYLGVHWPLDVFAGLLLGIVLSMIFYPIFEEISKNQDNKYIVSLIIGIISTLLAILLSSLLHFNLINETAFSDLMKTIAFSGGGFIGIAYETKKINFSNVGSLYQKMLRIIVVISGMLIIQFVLSEITAEAYYYIGASIRYLLVGLWLTAIFPKYFSILFK
ncbi:MAG: phosphatase PAP2 family protein [Spirochaetia bacterium]|nr:phosphatase PAP2 family protein [Spirochaetia bacterium]